MLERLLRDPALVCAWLFALGNLALVAKLPVLVGQDLPQHLAYVRILADYSDPRLPFQDVFTLPSHVQPYFTAYLLLVPLARLTSVLTAARILYMAYVVAMTMSFTALVRAVHSSPPGKTPWTAVLGPLLAWNPVALVGFLPFMLSLPAIVGGVAAGVLAARAESRRAYIALLVLSGLGTSLHLVAGATLIVLLGLLCLFWRTRGAVLGLGVSLVGLLLTLALWHSVGEQDLAPFPRDLWVASIRHSGLFQGSIDSLGVQWTPFAVKGTFVLATVLGPLTLGGKAAIAVGMCLLTAIVLVTKRERPSRVDARPHAVIAMVVCFLLVAVITPSAIREPDDICLLDFRMYVVAFLLAAALLDPRWFEPRRAHVGLALFAALLLAVWGRALGGTAGEAAKVVRLVSQLRPEDSILALSFHDRSEYLDETNAVTHYFPVYFTALRGGLTSLFWGKFSHHLPIGYRPERAPLRPPDWDPAMFTREELTLVSHVLVEWPDPDDGPRRVDAAARLVSELETGFVAKGCEGRHCLYAQTAPGVTRVEEARR
jgi:hypothetical protein